MVISPHVAHAGRDVLVLIRLNDKLFPVNPFIFLCDELLSVDRHRVDVHALLQVDNLSLTETFPLIARRSASPASEELSLLV